MLNRQMVRTVLQDLGLLMMAENDKGEPDYLPIIYEAMEQIASAFGADTAKDLTHYLTSGKSSWTFQYVVLEQENEENGSTHIIAPLDYQFAIAEVHWRDIAGDKAIIENFVEQCIYAAHEDMMSQKLWISEPRDWKNELEGQKIYEFKIDPMYRLRIWNYNYSLPQEYRPPEERDMDAFRIVSYYH